MNILLRKQKGVSLLELMVSLAIGAILLLTLASVYVTSSKTNKVREANEQLDEVARQVFDRLEYDLNLAGYIDIFDNDPNGANVIASKIANVSDEEVQRMYGRITETGANDPITPIEMAFPAVPNNNPQNPIPAPLANPVQAFVGSNTGMTVAYQVAPTGANNINSLPAANDVENVNSGWGLDCASQAPNPAQIRAGFVQNVYNYDAANQTLNCNGQPLVGSNVNTDTALNEMTFRYFVTTAADNNAGDVNLFNSQSGLYTSNILTAAEVQATPLQWRGVTAVEVCLIVAGAPLNGQLAELATVQPTVPTCVRNGAGNFAANAARGAGDSRLYRRYIKVLSIPNASYFTM